VVALTVSLRKYQDQDKDHEHQKVSFLPQIKGAVINITVSTHREE